MHNTTRVQSNLAKGRIAVFCPLKSTAFRVESIPPSNTWFLGPTWVGPRT